MITVNCLKCDNNNQLECIDCNVQVDDCVCITTTHEAYVGYLCHECMTVTEVDIEAYLAHDPNCLLGYEDIEEYSKYSYLQEIMDDEEDEDTVRIVDFTEDGDFDWNYYKDDTDQYWRSKTETWSKCRHYNHPLEFPDGTMVYPSSHTYRDEGDEAPDFGLYLDHCWEPVGLAGFIAWPDYDSPRFPIAAAHSIVDAYQKAQEGLWVEVGCIGGHGRTGTVLACMAVLAGVKPSNAVKWVKKNYCSHAVESTIQEWYVEFFGCFINGGSITEPDRKSYSKSAGGATTVPGQEFTFPNNLLDWKSIDFLRANATGSPSQELLSPDLVLVNNVSEFTTKEKIQIVKPNSNPDAPADAYDGEAF